MLREKNRNNHLFLVELITVFFLSNFEPIFVSSGDVYLCSKAEGNALDPCGIGFLFLGVAEQFAIAEAKLRAWASMDDDEDEDLDSEGSPGDGQTHTSFSRSAGSHLFHLSFISFCSSPFTSETSLKPPPPASSSTPPPQLSIHPQVF